MTNQKQCTACGAAPAADAPQGLCPACLFKQGLQSEPDATEDAGRQAAGFTPPAPAELAADFPDLEILELIGRGGMGIVYKARQKQLGRTVALKILSPAVANDPAFAERFSREARALAILNHPHIVAVYDFGRKGDRFYFLMEYVDGANLRQLLDGSRLAPREALAIVPQICEALQYAHDNGVVHRDIKPENLLLDKQGQVKIADFGLAKLAGRQPHEATLTGTGQVMGTLHYMAPEQTEHPQQVDHRADIYSLGVVFYQMLTGELPLGRFAPPSRKVEIDVRLDEVVLRALEKEPELRYQHASEIKTHVESIATTPPGKRPQPERPDAAAAYSAVRWTARVLGLLGFLFVLMFILAEGVPAFWSQPAPVQIELAGTVAMLAGLLVGWRLERLGAALIVAGWLVFAILERGRPPVPFTAFLAVAALYAYCGWRRVTPLAGPSPSAAALGSRPERPSRAPVAVARGLATQNLGLPVPATPRLSRVAVAGAVWAPFFVFVVVSTFVAVPVRVEAGTEPPGPAWWQITLAVTLLPLGLTAPFGTTICGAVSLAQIRHSGGRLYGLGLAVFDLLLYPLLVLDAVIGFVVFAVLRFVVARSGGAHVEMALFLPLGITFLICAAVDVLVFWLVWHAAKPKPD